ncbi:unnamed protein product, partial [Ceratitis capitata]
MAGEVLQRSKKGAARLRKFYTRKHTKHNPDNHFNYKFYISSSKTKVKKALKR